MINKNDHPVEWASMISDFDEIRDHIQTLINEMDNSKDYSEEEFSVDVGHLYAHLNRIWNGRNRTGEITDDEWTEDSKFPNDIEPIG